MASISNSSAVNIMFTLVTAGSIILGNIALLVYGLVQVLIFQAVPIFRTTPASVGGFGLNALGVGI
jgi:hypothetical protein